MAGTKPKELQINGMTLPVSQWKKRRDQLAKGFAMGAFTKETHMEHWRQWEVLVAKLREINEY